MQSRINALEVVCMILIEGYNLEKIIKVAFKIVKVIHFEIKFSCLSDTHYGTKGV